MTDTRKRDGQHRATIRLPYELWRALQREAEEQTRTANEQAVHLLRERYGLREGRGNK